MKRWIFVMVLVLTMIGGALAEGAALRLERPAWPTTPARGQVVITLTPNPAPVEIAQAGGTVVSLGVPFGPGVLDDASKLRVLQDGRELPVCTRELARWRIDHKVGSIRSVLVQFEPTMPVEGRTTVTLEYGVPATQRREYTPVAQTLVDEQGLEGPRIWATLPAQWLCDSWVAGPQLPVDQNRLYPEYDRSAERNHDGQLRALTSRSGPNWLFDRTTAIYRMYVRTGELKYLRSAYQCANFVRIHSAARGNFTLRDKYMYVYPRAQALHYLLAGDERALDLLKRQADLFMRIATESEVRYVPFGGFWTERNVAYAFSGLIYSYEILGGEERWQRMKMVADVLYEHQTRPPDGKPADGSWRHRWAQHGANESDTEGGSSPWMTALLFDPIFQYWLLSGDKRCPQMLVSYCEFLLAKGLVPGQNRAYYVADCFGESRDTASMASHNMEVAYMLAMGIYFSTDPAQRARFRERFTPIYRNAVSSLHTSPARRFNWAFQNSSIIPWLLTEAR